MFPTSNVVCSTTVVIKAMQMMFLKWPRLVAEYKPAFGSIFASYIKSYTHCASMRLELGAVIALLCMCQAGS